MTSCTTVPKAGLNDNSTAQNDESRARCSLPSSQTSPTQVQAQPVAQAAEEEPRAAVCPVTLPSSLPSPCSPGKGAGGNRDPLSGALALFFSRLPLLSVSAQTATSSEGGTTGYFLSHYLMPEQSTRARKLALEKTSCTAEHPFNTARIGEQTQAVSSQRRGCRGCRATLLRTGLRNRVEEETGRFEARLSIPIVLRSSTLTTPFFLKCTLSGNPTGILPIPAALLLRSGQYSDSPSRSRGEATLTCSGHRNHRVTYKAH